MAAASVVLDRVVRAWDYVRVDGHAVCDGRPADRIELIDASGETLATARLGLDVAGAGHLGPAGFSLSALVTDELDASTCALRAHFANEPAPAVKPLSEGNAGAWPDVDPLLLRMRDLVAAHPSPRVVEVGGRARSGVLHNEMLGPVAEYVGVDVLPGEGADVVADAHEMSAVLGRDRFDFACSYAVWEHLALPWKVVLELNRILVTGAYAYILAPQTCGMHDLPWDYFRFSDQAFRSLFAPETGFEVIETTRSHPLHVFPFFSLEPQWADAQNAAGFFNVSVLVRKTGPTSLEWPVDHTRLADSPYPA
jgi:SAM-dependent methyltransferase